MLTMGGGGGGLDCITIPEEMNYLNQYVYLGLAFNKHCWQHF